MGLTLHFHPLASFCWKALIAFYEKDVPFERTIVDFGDPQSADAFRTLWPMAKMPVLVDSDRNAVVAESTIIVEYLDSFHPGAERMVPKDPAEAWRVRFWDRCFDSYVHHPMQEIVTDVLRPAGRGDTYGLEQARSTIARAYDWLEGEVPGDGWMAGSGFTLADCSALPALFYANTLQPLGAAHPRLAAYLGRMMRRPSVARVLLEAEPFFGFYPLDPKPSRVPPAL